MSVPDAIQRAIAAYGAGDLDACAAFPGMRPDRVLLAGTLRPAGAWCPARARVAGMLVLTDRAPVPARPAAGLRGARAGHWQAGGPACGGW
jgi:hypothetical protein